MRLDGLGERIEVVVEQRDDVVPRPQVGDRREPPQVDHDDRRLHGKAASACRGARQDRLAGVRTDIGVEQGPREPVLQPHIDDARQHRQQFRQHREFVVVEAARPIGREGDEVALAEREGEGPGDVVGHPLLAQLGEDGERIVRRRRRMQAATDLVRALLNRRGRAEQVGVGRDAVIGGRQPLRLGHPAAPVDAHAEPLRMVGLQEHRSAGERHATALQPLAELDEHIVQETLVACLVDQPVQSSVPQAGPMTWRGETIGLRVDHDFGSEERRRSTRLMVVSVRLQCNPKRRCRCREPSKVCSSETSSRRPTASFRRPRTASRRR